MSSPRVTSAIDPEGRGRYRGRFGVRPLASGAGRQRDRARYTSVAAQRSRVSVQMHRPGPLWPGDAVLHGRHGGRTTLIDTVTSTVTGFDGVAVARWEAAVGTGLRAALIEEVLQCDDVQPAALRVDVDAFVDGLLAGWPTTVVSVGDLQPVDRGARSRCGGDRHGAAGGAVRPGELGAAEPRYSLAGRRQPVGGDRHRPRFVPVSLADVSPAADTIWTSEPDEELVLRLRLRPANASQPPRGMGWAPAR